MRLMTVKKTAQMLDLSESMLRSWIKMGECPGIQHGNRFYINVDMLIEKIEEMSRVSK